MNTPLVIVATTALIVAGGTAAGLVVEHHRSTTSAVAETPGHPEITANTLMNRSPDPTLCPSREIPGGVAARDEIERSAGYIGQLMLATDHAVRTAAPDKRTAIITAMKSELAQRVSDLDSLVTTTEQQIANGGIPAVPLPAVVDPYMAPCGEK